MLIVGLALAVAVIAGLGFLMHPLVALRPPAPAPSYLDPKSGATKRFPSLFDPATLDISLIVPAYNEESRLPIMMDSTLDFMDSWSASTDDGVTFEVIIVDDGSRDGTARVAQDIAARRGADCVRILRVQPNRGKGNAVRQGMLAARGRALLFLDADGATGVSEIRRITETLRRIQRNSLGVVVGSRAAAGDADIERNPIRRFLAFVFHLLVLLCVRGVDDTQCGFKMFSREAARRIFPNQRVERWSFDVELLRLARQQDIPIAEMSVEWREIPGSHMRLSGMIGMARDLVLLWLMYTLGVWGPKRRPAQASKRA